MSNATYVDTLKIGNKFEFSVWEYKVLVPASAQNNNTAVVLNLTTDTQCEFNGNVLVYPF